MFRILGVLLVISMPLILQAKQKICLNMIVKNESAVIKRCLDSVKPVIDYWVIVDTGSTDETKKIIKKELKNIPGELYERPWKNFGESRSEAFNLARGKGDYILFMDADDVLEFEKEVQIPFLTQDLYSMWRGTKDFQYLKPQIARGNLPWKWVGVTHEYLDCDVPFTSSILQEVKYVSKDGGASSCDPQKFIKNVKLLEEGIKKEPNNHRYAFYLAESLRDAGDKPKALHWFQKRVDMGGWAEEVYWSLLQIGHMLSDLGLAPNIVIEAYKNAHAYRPHRAEAVYYLAEAYNHNDQFLLAYECIKQWERLPKPNEKDYLFNIQWIETFGLLFQISICSYYAGHYQEALEACDRLLTMDDLPESWHERTVGNREFPLTKLQTLLSQK